MNKLIPTRVDNATGETLLLVRWTVETPSGRLGCGRWINYKERK